MVAQNESFTKVDIQKVQIHSGHLSLPYSNPSVVLQNGQNAIDWQEIARKWLENICEQPLKRLYSSDMILLNTQPKYPKHTKNDFPQYTVHLPIYVYLDPDDDDHAVFETDAHYHHNQHQHRAHENVNFVPTPVPRPRARNRLKNRSQIVDDDTTVLSFHNSFNDRRVQFSAPLPVREEARMPNIDSMDSPVLTDNRDGTISLKYDPRNKGEYEMAIKYNQQHIKGSPYKFVVDNTSRGTMTAFGSGLSQGIAGEPCSFTVHSGKSGAVSGLQVGVEGPAKAEINCIDNKDGTVSVVYIPPAPGHYKINVKYENTPIVGSPFTAKVVGEGRKRNQISVAMASEVPLKIGDKEVRLLNASIVAPSGLEEPCVLKRLNASQLAIQFTPRENGQHQIVVKKLGNPIVGSPFMIHVLERDIGNAKNVKVLGPGLKSGKTNQANEIEINTKEAGYGGLSLSIEGPSKVDLQYKEKDSGVLAVSYNPTEPGFYIMNLKFADYHVPGSPFTIKVDGKGSNVQRQNLKKERELEPVVVCGSKCKMTFKIPATCSFDMSAKIQSPSGEVEDVEITESQNCLYAVHFVPKELGVHIISVKHKEVHIPGSPFPFTVGPLEDFGAHKVHAGGSGLERATCGEKCEFNVWTREAGAGSLAVSVEGPSKAEIDFIDRNDGSGTVTYSVSEPGDYRIGVKFNDEHIPDSPFKVYAARQVGDARKVEISGIPPENMCKVNAPVNFNLNMNGAKGQLDGKVVAPSGTEDDCFMMKVDDDLWALRFIPRENGVHKVLIRLEGVHIPESPFAMRIGHDTADPAAVLISGNGIKEARCGVKADFTIDTTNAGSGTLAVTIDGPSKVSMDCTDVEIGYKVRYTPLAPGEYLITIKYNGFHIVGSPFKVRCFGSKSFADIANIETTSVAVETVVKQPTNAANMLPKFASEARMVECKGAALKKAIMHRQNTFQVLAQNAGDNMLAVSVLGPRGPVEMLDIRHQGRNNYNVTFVAKERGEHFIVVKYGDENVPGSPFKIDCGP